MFRRVQYDPCIESFSGKDSR